MAAIGELPGEMADLAAHLSASVPRAWLVGGCVRDALLGRPIQDVDVAVPDALAAAQGYAAATGGSYVLLHDAHPTAAVIDAGTGRRVDFCELRGSSIDDDLRQRDFTVDALAIALCPAVSPRVVDPTGGVADLRSGRLRMVSPEALDADPVRLLRAFRLAAQLHLCIDGATLAAIAHRADRIAEPSRERVREELVRLFSAERPYAEIDAMIESGVAAALLAPCPLSPDRARPALEAGDRLIGEARDHPACRRALQDLVVAERLLPWLRLAFLLGRRNRADIAVHRENLRTSRAELGALMAYTTPVQPAFGTPRRGAAQAWGLLSDGALGAMLVSAAWDEANAAGWQGMLLALCAEVYPTSRAAPLVSGSDLMDALDLYGPALGQVAAALRAAQLAGEIATAEGAMALARSVADRIG